MAFMTSVIWNFVCKKKKKNNFFFFVSLMKNKNEFLFTSLTSILNFVLKQTRGCSDLVPPKIKQAVYCFKKKKKKLLREDFPWSPHPSPTDWGDEISKSVYTGSHDLFSSIKCMLVWYGLISWTKQQRMNIGESEEDTRLALTRTYMQVFPTQLYIQTSSGVIGHDF